MNGRRRLLSLVVVVDEVMHSNSIHTSHGDIHGLVNVPLSFDLAQLSLRIVIYTRSIIIELPTHDGISGCHWVYGRDRAWNLGHLLQMAEAVITENILVL